MQCLTADILGPEFSPASEHALLQHNPMCKAASYTRGENKWRRNHILA